MKPSKNSKNSNRKKKHSRKNNGIESIKKVDIIYSQNAQGIFESEKDTNGDPIPGKRSQIKLNYIVLLM